LLLLGDPLSEGGAISLNFFMFEDVFDLKLLIKKWCSKKGLLYEVLNVLGQNRCKNVCNEAVFLYFNPKKGLNNLKLEIKNSEKSDI